MNQTDFNNDILMSLGNGLVDVEFSEIGVDGDNLLDFAFRRARDVYIQKGADDWKPADVGINIVSGTKTYTLPTTGGKISTIVKVYKPTLGFNIEDPGSLALFNDLISGINGTGAGTCSYVDLTTYNLALARIEDIKNLTAFDEPFSHNPIDNTITFVRTPQVSETWFLDAYRQLTDDEYRDVLWVKEYAEAEAKTLLGNAYRKLNGAVAGPNGPMQLSGDQMIQEAKERKNELLEDINTYTDGNVQYSGIYMG